MRQRQSREGRTLPTEESRRELATEEQPTMSKRDTIHLTAADFAVQARAYRRQGNAEAADTILALARWLGVRTTEQEEGPTWVEWSASISIARNYGVWRDLQMALQALAAGTTPTPALFNLPSMGAMLALLRELERGIEHELERGPRAWMIAPVDFAMAYLRCREAGGAAWVVAAFARSLGIQFTRAMFKKAREYLEDYPESLWPSASPAQRKRAA